MIKIVLLSILCFSPCILAAQKASTLFNKSTMQYKGNKGEQLKLLFRQVSLWGEIHEAQAEVDSNFTKRIESDLQIDKKQLREYLGKHQIGEKEVGGNIDSPVSCIVPKEKMYARYFVIHDTSFPVYKDRFHEPINDSLWTYNAPERWHRKVTHIYVTRTGKCNATADFGENLIGTKFEKSFGAALRGLYLHIEMVQPRLYPPGNTTSAPIAPSPGFTNSQYTRLALLYICASVRKGEWLVPAFHAVIDEGIKNAHDDPQGFDRKMFTDEVLRLEEEIRRGV